MNREGNDTEKGLGEEEDTGKKVNAGESVKIETRARGQVYSWLMLSRFS